MFDNFPKTRTPLPKKYRSIYLTLYSENRNGRSILAKVRSYLESWMHIQVSKNRENGNKLLEIGAGHLNHINYEEGYEVYDIIEPLNQEWDSDLLAKVNHCYSSISEIESDLKYSRVFSIAVLEHIEDLPNLVARSLLLLREGGKFQAAIPCEGSFMWFFASRLLVGLAFRLKYGLSYNTLMNYEHVNNYFEIVEVVNYFFEKVEIKKMPNMPFHLSLYAYIEASDPRMDRVHKYSLDYEER
ncbi:MAG: methyltransferase domain-containing protein [Bacteroidota bacterium]